MRKAVAMLAMLAATGAGATGAGTTGVAAQTVATEVSRVNGAEVTRHMHGFLSAEERALLQVVATTPAALEVLLGAAPDGHAAMAVAPGEGLLRGGVPVESAHAIAGLGDRAAARAAALEGCEALRQAGPACVVVLEVAP